MKSARNSVRNTDTMSQTESAEEQQIRERAYHLWEADGRPHGREDEYWERARELIGIESAPDFGQLPNPLTQGDGKPGPLVEEAFLQDNLGEFPDRFSDQGDRRQTPSAQPDEDAPVVAAHPAKKSLKVTVKPAKAKGKKGK